MSGHVLSVGSGEWLGHPYDRVFTCSCGQWAIAPLAWKVDPPDGATVGRWHLSHANATVISLP